MELVDILGILIALVFIVVWWLYKVDSRLMVVLGLLILVLSGLFLTLNDLGDANLLATIAFYFFLTGIFLVIIEAVFEQRRARSGKSTPPRPWLGELDTPMRQALDRLKKRLGVRSSERP